MSLLTHQYSLTTPPPHFPPPGVPALPPLWGPAIQVTYVEVTRQADGKPESDMLPSPKLTYKDPVRVLDFSGDKLETSELEGTGGAPTLGRLLTVQLDRSDDVGATYFSVLLPAEPEHPQGALHMTTVGITSHAPGPDSLVKETTWQPVSLSGVYSVVQSEGA